MNIGDKFGMLTVKGFVRVRNGTKAFRIDALCNCDCGRIDFSADKSRLRRGKTTNCGCMTSLLQSNSARKRGAVYQKHGQVNSPTYYSWAGMKSRCLNQNDRRYKDYGGRGVQVCERWMDFRTFLEDMGERPEGLTLDRIDNNGNYEPSNCHWVGSHLQAANKRNSSRKEK